MLGSDYLRGASYYDDRGETHPVSVEAVLMNEIAHVWRRTADERTSNDIERIVMNHFGVVPRALDRVDVDFQRGAHGGYVTVSDGVMLLSPGQRVDFRID